jgi:predicted acyltransferase
MALDALRGFDMFWIIGGSVLLRAVAKWIGWEPFIQLATEQTEHVGWDGFRAYDLIFPLFVFLSGVTLPLALTRRLEQGISRWVLYGRLLRRAVLLVFLGMAPDLFLLDPDRFRPLSVLGLIGMAYLWAGLVVLQRGVRGQLAWAAGILVGYYLALTFLPVPGVGAGMITPGGHMGGYIDRNLWPGQLYQRVFDPEGFLNTFPAAALALFGAAAGHLLLANRPSPSGKVAALASWGLGFLALGYTWGMTFPVVKAIWSSTFILVAGGWSLLLLGLFYLVIDVWGFRRLGFVLVPIGMNAITIYVARSYVKFDDISPRIFGGLARHAGPLAGPVVLAAGVLLIEWGLLYFLYRKKVFLRA